MASGPVAKHKYVLGSGGSCALCGLSRMVYVHSIEFDTNMPEEHEAHLERVKNRFLEDVDRAYREGAKQHGGKLWRKPGLIRMAMKECVDQYVYLEAMLEQAEDPNLLDPNEKDIDA